MINYGDADGDANVLVHPTTVGGFAAVATRLIRKGEEVGLCFMVLACHRTTMKSHALFVKGIQSHQLPCVFSRSCGLTRIQHSGKAVFL